MKADATQTEVRTSIVYTNALPCIPQPQPCSHTDWFQFHFNEHPGHSKLALYLRLVTHFFSHNKFDLQKNKAKVVIICRPV